MATKKKVKAKPAPTKTAKKTPRKATKEKVVKEQVKSKKKSKVVEVSPEDLAKRKASIDAYMLGNVESVIKEENLMSSLNDDYRLQITGLLTLSILLDGGLNPSWFSVSGEERSSKSASALTMCRACVDAGVPIIQYHDAENAVKEKFARSMLKVKSSTELFGVRNDKGEYITPRRIQYFKEGRLEKVFRTIRKSLLRLPDKQYNEFTKKWYYVFDRTKEAKKMWEAMGLKDHDKKLYTQTGSYWFEAPDDTLQAFFVIDSLPALISTTVADDEDSSNKQVGYLAGPLSRQIPLVKIMLKSKHAAVLVVNQLRDKILLGGGKSYGPSKKEPGGNAAAFFSDFRLQFAPIWPLDGYVKSKEHSETCVETSVEGGGKDYYQFKKMKVIKTKTSAVGAITYARVWVKDCNGNPRGYDPVFDTWQALSDLRLVSGKRLRSFRIKLRGFEEIDFDWDMFKYCILIETEKSKKLWLKFVQKYKPNFKKPLKIRKAVSDLIAKGNLDQYTVKELSTEDEFIDIDGE